MPQSEEWRLCDYAELPLSTTPHTAKSTNIREYFRGINTKFKNILVLESGKKN
jgi:hypothetical protein